jgi:hypothetical protein
MYLGRGVFASGNSEASEYSLKTLSNCVLLLMKLKRLQTYKQANFGFKVFSRRKLQGGTNVFLYQFVPQQRQCNFVY